MLDKYQSAVCDFVEANNLHLVVRARAGSGKTTTIMELVDRIPGKQTVLLTAFNNDIAAVLRERAPARVLVKTTHQLGKLGITAALRRPPTIDKDKGSKIALRVLEDYHRSGQHYRNFSPRKYAYMLKKLVERGKNTLVKSERDLEKTAIALGLEDSLMSGATMGRLAAECMRRAAADPSMVDFDDMLYIPVKLNMYPPQFDNVLVDEAQDINAAQLWSLVESCRQRFIAVGDEAQAIYLFRGADALSIPNIIKRFNAHELPLSYTYRCAPAIVEHVKQRVPTVKDLASAPHLSGGAVRSMSKDELYGPWGPKPGDFILSRVNAPLIGICMHLLAHGVPCRVAGRDIGRALVGVVEKTYETDTARMIAKLRKMLDDEEERLEDHGEEAAQALERANDQYAAVCVLAEGCPTTREVIQKINAIFADDTPHGAVICSTVHKAKGLEADRVWLLSWTFFLSTAPEESNLYYVAATRAKNDLYLVTQ